MSIPVPQRVNNKLLEDFYPVQKEELMALRRVKLINNAAYVHLALRYENPYCDRPVEIIPKQFALRWQIPESSVYKVIAKLKELGVLNIKSGKLVIDWIIKPENKPVNVEPEPVTEPIAVNDFSDPAKNYQIQQKIIRSDNSFSDSAKNYQDRENQGLKPLPDIGSLIPQTIQTIQTNQTNQTVEEKTFSQEEKQPEKEVVQNQVQDKESKKEKKLVSLAETLEEVSRDVVQKKSKIECTKVCTNEREKKVCTNKQKKKVYRSPEIPEELKEKLRSLEIPLDSKVVSAIASHDISQAYGACAHVENTWETITNPRGVFLFQLPKQPIEKLGSRYSEEIINNIKAQNQAIDEERKDPEYQKRSSEFFAQIRASLGRASLGKEKEISEVVDDDPWL